MKNEKIKTAIKEKRLSNGWTKAEVSRRTGISQQQLCDIEAGRKNPSLTSMVSLAKCLGLSLDKLFLQEVC